MRNELMNEYITKRQRPVLICSAESSALSRTQNGSYLCFDSYIRVYAHSIDRWNSGKLWDVGNQSELKHINTGFISYLIPEKVSRYCKNINITQIVQRFSICGPLMCSERPA
jgi:hypothetical protein